MNKYRESINRQYGSKNLNVRLIEAIRKAGTKVDKLTLSDLFWFDQHHAGGVDSTRALASMAGLKTGMEVLDVGSGVGGSSRILAAEYGCRVTGLASTSQWNM